MKNKIDRFLMLAGQGKMAAEAKKLAFVLKKAEGYPDNLTPEQGAEWEANTEKYKDKFTK